MLHTSSRTAPFLLGSLLLASQLTNAVRLHAAITSTGDVSPDPTTIMANETLYIGNNSVGEVTIDGGSVLENGYGWLGRYDGGEGTVTVDGAGSVWRNTQSIILGNWNSTGVGHLGIRNGGLVEATYSLSSSTAAGHSIYFDGGTLQVPNLGVDLSILQGTGVVETDGWMIDGVHTITSLADLPTTLLLAEQPGQNITVNIDWMSTMATFGVNNGDVIVNNGAQIKSYFDTYVGKTPGSVGSLEFSGAGTRWDLYDLDIGRVSQGELTISDGAVVSARDVYMAYENGVATAHVTGIDSLWELEYLNLANQGQATLNISGGGEVRNTSDAYLGTSSSGAGVVNVSGPGSKFVVDRWMTIGDGGDGELHISNGGQVTTGDDVIVARYADHFGMVAVDGANSQWNVAGDIFVGASGQGSLSITNGGVVTSGEAYVGKYIHETQVVIDGAGSRWSIDGYLYFSNGGRAVATISNGGLLEVTGDLVLNAYDNGSYIQLDGGTISARSLLANGSDLHGSGTINAKAWALNGNWTIAQMADLPTQLLLDQSPEQNITVNLDWTGAGPLGSNDGVLTITDGSALTSAWSYAGYTTGSVGVVNVSGAGNTWNSGYFVIGESGHGAFNLSGGATATSSSPNISRNLGSTGIVCVTGPGTTWTTTGWLDFGRGGVQSEMHIADGGTVQSDLVSFRWGGQSLATVDGSGTSWSASSTLILQRGAIEVTGGASLIAATATVGDLTNADALVTIDGNGSQWTIAGTLKVDRINNETVRGTVHVANGGSVLVGGDLFLKAGSTIGATLASTTDPLIDVAGDAILAGELNIDLAPDFALQPGQVFTLIDVVGARSGFFNGLAQNAVVASFGGADLTISYSGGDGNDIVLISTGLSGDYDSNGIINGKDFLAWQRGDSPDPYSAADMNYWAANFSYPTPPLSRVTTVPEPTPQVLATIAMMVLACRRNRKGEGQTRSRGL